VTSDPIAPPVVETPGRRAFYERISRQNLTPLWLSLPNLVTAEPTSGCTRTCIGPDKGNP
jgi:gentisate 1,2-dioxygenase